MISRALRAAALAIVATAALVVVPSASAVPATLNTLTHTNGVLNAFWTLPAGASSWELELSQDFDFATSFKQPLQPTDTTFTAPSALPPGTYYARIISTETFAVCDLNVSDPLCILEESNSMSVTVPPPATNPANLVALTQSGGVLSARWTLPTGVESWELEVGTTPGTDSFGYFNDYFTFSELHRADTSTTIGPLPPGTYYVHIISTPSFDECVSDFFGPLCFLDFSNIGSITVPAPAAPPPPPPPAVVAADKVVSLGAVTAASSQDVDKLSITLNPGESVKVKLSGSVSVPGASKVFRFTTVNKSLGAGKTKLSLKLSKKAKKAVKKALKRKKKLKAKLTLIVTDNAGNSQTKKYTVRLKP